MTRIIPLSPTDPQLADRLCTAGWQFTHAVLWAEQPLSKEEVTRVLALVKDHLDYPSVCEHSFTQFCERVLLAREQQLVGMSGYIGQPSVWLHPGNREGYGATELLYDELRNKRQLVPGYRKEYNVLVTGYYKYQLRLRAGAFRVCRRHLLRLKAYGLLTLLYRVMIYSKFSHR